MFPWHACVNPRRRSPALASASSRRMSKSRLMPGACCRCSFGRQAFSMLSRKSSGGSQRNCPNGDHRASIGIAGYSSQARPGLNLPTVWTNVLAGTILGGGDAGGARTVLVALAMSMFYIGGMYLNDYCDRHIDARERPERPIRGRNFANDGSGHRIRLALRGHRIDGRPWGRGGGREPALAAAIIAYDWFHKRNPVAPLVMGLCRGLVYYVPAPRPSAISRECRASLRSHSSLTRQG